MQRIDEKSLSFIQTLSIFMCGVFLIFSVIGMLGYVVLPDVNVIWENILMSVAVFEILSWYLQLPLCFIANYRTCQLKK